MKLKTAAVIAVAIHAVIVAGLIINVSLDRPQKPEDNTGNLMHATFVPPAKGNPDGKAEAPKPAASSAVEESAPAIVDNSAAKQAAEDLKYQIQKQREEEAKRQEIIEQKRIEEEQKALALKKAQAEKKKLEEQKKKLEEQKKAQELKKQEEAKKKAEAEAKKKAEAEAKKKAEAEAKKKAEEEAKKKAEAEAKKKTEDEAKKKAEADAKRKAEADAKRKADAAAKAQADSLEDSILGTADGDPVNGKGLGSGSGDSAGYGSKVRTLIEQNWRVDPSMNGKSVKVMLEIASDGTVKSKNCEGNSRVCKSALDAIDNIGMFPMPPSGCVECSVIHVTMTPKI